MSTSLEELRSRATIIDATNGKVDRPVEQPKVPHEPTLAETDPAFTPTVTDGGIRGGGRTPTIEGSPNQPTIKTVDAKFDATNAVEFDINSLPKRKVEKSEFENRLMDNLDKAVEREKESITRRINELTEKQYEEFMAEKQKDEDKEFISEDIDSEEKYESEDYEDDDSYEVPTPKIIIPADKPIYEEEERLPNVKAEEAEQILSEIDEDIDDDLGNIADVENSPLPSNSTDEDLEKDLATETGPDMDDIFKSFTADAKKKITPIKRPINLNEFKISDNAITRSVANMISFKDVSTADHFLPSSGKIVSCSALSGSELVALNPQNSNRNRMNTLKDIYSIIYKHIVSDKAKTFDEWLKTTPFSDLDHIYFALYKATFANSNFVHYECPNKNCSDVFIEDVNFDDMIVYDSDKTKEAMQAIMDSADTSINEYQVTMYQISDDHVVGLRNPSIYNVVLEFAGLSDEFLDKYSDLMDIIIYIDSLYYINRETNMLDPIDMMPDKNSLTKTIGRRIKIISSILRNLPSDNYYELRKSIVDTYPSLSNVSYHIPACKCKKCGTDIPEMKIEAQQLLFMRHQLGAFAVL